MIEKRPTSGIGLLELLVATTILSIMVLMLFQILNNTSTAWALGQSQTERRQSARALADAMAQELQSALMPVDPADQKSLQFILNPSMVPSTYANADTLFWQAPVATDRTYGDVAEVGYFLKWDQSRVGNPRPLLCRFFVNPTDNANYLIIRKPTAWLSGDILEQVAPGTNQPTNSYAGLFAENVIGFWVRCFDASGNIVQNYDSRTAQKLPRTVKIYLVLISPASLPRLRTLPDYTKAGGASTEPNVEQFIAFLPDGVRETARSYTTEVRLQNAL